MVESSQGILDSKLDKDWMALAVTQPATKQFIDECIKRPLDEGNLVAYFNQKLVSIIPI